MATAVPAIDGERPRSGLRATLARIRQRLRQRADSEHEMTPNRLAFATIVLGALSILTWTGSETAAGMLALTLPAFCAFYGTSLAIFLHILWRPAVSPARRLVAMVIDFAMISYAAGVCGQEAGFFYPLFLWTVFGNGFRFGVPYLHAATVVGLIGFVLAIGGSGYWSEHHGLTVAMLIGLAILPLYAAVLIRKLSEAKRVAEEANRAKSLFLAGVSHELRTPLNAIIGFSDLLGRQPLARSEAEMARTIAASGRSLLALIDDILDYSRMEAGQVAVSRAPIELPELLRRVRAMLSVEAAAKGLVLAAHVGPDVPRRVLADARHLQEVLVNLTANAVKFTEAGHVLIAVERLPGSDRLRFSVADTGIGISEAAQTRIFESFTQADETIIDRYGGTGLGLTIVERLVTLLGGTIQVASVLGAGSTFHFDLDLAAAEDDDAALPEGFAPLLVSADRLLAAEVAAVAPGMVGADDLADALRAIERTAPSMVLIDASLLAADPDGLTLSPLADRLDGEVPLVLVGLPLRPVSAAMKTRVDARIQRPVRRRDLQRVAGPGRPAVASAAGTADGQPTLNVLIAEDNRTNQMVLARLLEAAGHTSVTADDGDAALDCLLDQSFDVVLMDVNMPGTNGIEATKLYRFLTLGLPRVPIVALTADATPEARARCLAAGMDAVATKPIDLDRLLDVIASVLPGDVHLSAPPVPHLLFNRIDASFGRDDGSRRSTPDLDTSSLDTLKAIGGPGFVEELVTAYLGDATPLLRRLADAVARHDLEGFRFVAHALRSASSNLGAESVAALCLGWRDITDGELARDGERHLRALDTAFARLRDALELYTAPDAIDTRPEGRPDPLARPDRRRAGG